MSINQFDPRILNVQLEFEDGTYIYGDPMYIKVQGFKAISVLQNIATITIGNLRKDHRDYILSNCNQVLQAQYKIRKVTVFAGRQSTGAFQVYQGDVVSANISQPPDVMLVIRAATSARDRTNFLSFSNTANLSLGQAINELAQVLNLNASIDPAVDATQTVPRFTFFGQPLGAIARIQELYKVKVFTDDNILVVKPWNESLSNTIVNLNKSTGMIGIPEFTEYGIRVKTFVDKNIRLGAGLRLVSEMVPAMNADYVITRLDYDMSTRETSFYYDVWANRSG